MTTHRIYSQSCVLLDDGRWVSVAAGVTWSLAGCWAWAWARRSLMITVVRLHRAARRPSVRRFFPLIRRCHVADTADATTGVAKNVNWGPRFYSPFLFSPFRPSLLSPLFFSFFTVYLNSFSPFLPLFSLFRGKCSKGCLGVWRAL